MTKVAISNATLASAIQYIACYFQQDTGRTRWITMYSDAMSGIEHSRSTSKIHIHKHSAKATISLVWDQKVSSTSAYEDSPSLRRSVVHYSPITEEFKRSINANKWNMLKAINGHRGEITQLAPVCKMPTVKCSAHLRGIYWYYTDAALQSPYE